MRGIYEVRPERWTLRVPCVVNSFNNALDPLSPSPTMQRYSGNLL